MTSRNVAEEAAKKAVPLAPSDGPDPLIWQQRGRIAAPVSRIDGPLKVQDKAPLAKVSREQEDKP